MANKTPYSLNVGSVYQIKNHSGYYLVTHITKAPSGVYVFHLTYFHSTDKSNTEDIIWHQYGDYTSLVKLTLAPKVVQILYGKSNL